jgi:UDP-N-acetylmuramate--alanine ligase
MESYQNISKCQKIHFIGIGGVSVSALSRHLISQNKEVSGSDIQETADFLKVKACGGKVKIGSFPEGVKEADVVVYSQAISKDNPDLKLAKTLRKPTYSRSKLLGEIISEYKNSISVAGSHGKTTTTAMISCALIEAGKSPTCFCGGNTYRFGNYLLGDSDFIVAEACEYKKSFLDIKSKISVILNVDDDHLDCYGSIKELMSSFEEFAKGSMAVVNVDDENANSINCPLRVTYGIEGIASYKAERIKEYDNGIAFTVRAYGIKLGRIRLKVLGRHNVYNALATVAVLDLLKIPFDKTKKGLEEFDGVERRNEVLGQINGLKIISDYAHHPSEIQATLSIYNGDRRKFFTVFQPHTYSRTKILMKEFVTVLNDVKDLIIYKTYSAREEYDESGDGKTLCDNLKKQGKKDVYYCDNKQDLIELIGVLGKKYSKCLTLGAGDMYGVVKELVK